MSVTKKIFFGFFALTIVMHSLFIPLALPGFVLCFGSDGNFTIEREKAVQHEHNDRSFKVNIKTIVANENYLLHLENCFVISLDRDNDYQIRLSNISPEFSWKIQDLFGIEQEENNSLFLLKYFFIDTNPSLTQPLSTINVTQLMI